MRECIALEHEEPATVNEHYLADYKRKFHARYKAARKTHIRNVPNLQTLVNGGYDNTNIMRSTMQYLGEMGLDNVKRDDLLRLIPVDPADTAIEIMSEVRAYYQGGFHNAKAIPGLTMFPSCIQTLCRLHSNDHRL